MKAVIVLCFLAVAAVALARPDEKYTDKYDNVNIKEILETKRLLKAYIACLLETAGFKCPSDGAELKKHIKEALENGCGLCTDKQKEGVREVLTFLINKEPEYWKQLTAKYDPENKYAKMYEDEYKSLTA